MKFLRFVSFFVFLWALSLLLCSCLPEDKPLTDKNNVCRSELEGKWSGEKPIDPLDFSDGRKQQVTIVNYGDYYCFSHTNQGVKKFILTKLGDVYFVSIRDIFVHKDRPKYNIFRISISSNEISLWGLSHGAGKSLSEFEKKNGKLSQKDLCDWCREHASLFSEKTEYCYKRLEKLSQKNIQETKNEINKFFNDVDCKKKEFQQLLQQAKNGDPDAQYRVAKYYEKECHGIIQKEDKDFMVNWLIPAAKSGHKLAAYELSSHGIPDSVYKTDRVHDNSNVACTSSGDIPSPENMTFSENEPDFWGKYYGVAICAVIILGIIVFIYEICSIKDNGIEKHIKILLMCTMAVIACGFIQETIHWPTYYNSSSIGRFIGAWLGTSLISGAFFWLTIILCILALILCNNRNKQQQKIVIEKECECAKVKALEELQNGTVDKQTWANALIAADGDEIKAKAEYLKLRKFK